MLRSSKETSLGQASCTFLYPSAVAAAEASSLALSLRRWTAAWWSAKVPSMRMPLRWYGGAIRCGASMQRSRSARKGAPFRRGWNYLGVSAPTTWCRLAVGVDPLTLLNASRTNTRVTGVDRGYPAAGYALNISRHHRVQAASPNSWAVFWPFDWPKSRHNRKRQKSRRVYPIMTSFLPEAIPRHQAKPYSAVFRKYD